MCRGLLLVSLFLVISSAGRFDALSIVWHKLQKLMRIHPRAKFDKSKCAIRPEKLYGHFIDERVYPNEIHNFYINENQPLSEKALGKNLKPISRRILRLDSKYSRQVKPFVVYRIEACIPNDNYLRPSWE